MIPDNTPDAVYLPPQVKRGRGLAERVASATRVAEPLLGVDRDAGERAYLRDINAGGGPGKSWVFATKSPDDTLLFPLNAPGPLRGRPRYSWVDGPSGYKLGYLRPEARELDLPKFDPVSAGLIRLPGM